MHPRYFSVKREKATTTTTEYAPMTESEYSVVVVVVLLAAVLAPIAPVALLCLLVAFHQVLNAAMVDL